VNTGSNAVDFVLGLGIAIVQPTVTFTETEMIIKQGDKAKITPVTYRKENNSWFVCIEDKKSVSCEVVSFGDQEKNQMTMSLFSPLEITFRRVIKSEVTQDGS
jgi:hypothetical protein